MKYTLMHKSIPVVDMEIDSAKVYISKLRDVYDPRRLPVGVNILETGVDCKALNAYHRMANTPNTKTT